MKFNRKLTLSVFICAGVLSLYPINEIHVKAAETASIENTTDNGSEEINTGANTQPGQGATPSQNDDSENTQNDDSLEQHPVTPVAATTPEPSTTNSDANDNSGSNQTPSGSTTGQGTGSIGTDQDADSQNNDKDKYPVVTLPVYEVNFSNTMDDPDLNKYQIGSAGLEYAKQYVDASTGKTVINYGVPSYLTDGIYGTDKTRTYRAWSEGPYYNYNDGKLYSDINFRSELKCLYYQIASGNFNINFIDSSSDQRIGGGTYNLKVYSGDIDINTIDAPEGYTIKSGQSFKYDLKDSNTMNRDIKVIKLNPANVVVKKTVTDNEGHSASVQLEKAIPFGVVKSTDNWEIKRKISAFLTDKNITDFIMKTPDSGKNNDYDPSISGDTITLNEVKDGKVLNGGSLPLKNLNDVINVLFDNVQEDMLGVTYNFTVNYTYDKPINWDVVIPSNKIDKPVPTVPTQGHLGQKVTVKVPVIDGYTADKATIQATVGADGTIVADESVNYTKKSTDNNNSSSSSSSDDESDDRSYSAVNINLGITDQAKVYDSNANVTNNTVDPLSDFTSNEKMINNGETYYRVGDNRWVKATDTYIYEKFNGFVRTYENSDKSLIDVKDNLSNRGLLPLTNWITDRYAEFNNEKYYRVATDEWIKASDVFTYQPESTIINAEAGTILYNDHGNAVRVMDKSMGLKSDLVANINNQAMYRVATNEYVLASDIK